MKKTVSMIGLLCLFSVLIGCSEQENKVESESNNSNQKNSEEEVEEVITEPDTIKEEPVDRAEIISELKIAKDAKVATVNGDEILGEKYNVLLGQTVETLEAYGMDISDSEMVKKKHLDAVINQKLLDQELEKIVVNVTETQIDNTLEKFKNNFDTNSAYTAYLNQLKLSEKELKDQIADEIRLQHYLDLTFGDIEVSNEMINEYYQQQYGGSENPPKLENVEQEIKSQIEVQLKTEKLSEKIKELSNEAEIEIHIS